MARDEKKTRIRGIPPKFVLDELDSHTGSLPTIARTASDNRTGTSKIYYDDRNTVNFLVSQSIIAGTNLPANRLVATNRISSLGDDLLRGKMDDEFGPVLFYKFDDNLTDSSGNSIDLIVSAANDLSGTVGYNRGFADSKKAFEFDGNNFLYASPNPVFQISGAMTAQVLFNFVNTPLSNSQQGTLLMCGERDKFAGAEDNTHYHISAFYNEPNDEWNVSWKSEEGNLQKLFVWSKTAGTTNGKDINLETRRYHHLAISRATSGSGELSLYIDGEFISTGSTYDFSSGQGISASLFIGADGEQPGIGRIVPSLTRIAGIKVHDQQLNGAQVRKEATKALYGDFVISGSVRKGVSDTLISFTPGQNLRPFDDDLNTAADFTGTNNPFYATGSSVLVVGEGFESPLWSKTKVEIDITPTAEHELSVRYDYAGGGSNHPMAYWNPNAKRWEGIGEGNQFTSVYATGTLAGQSNLDPHDDIKNLIQDSTVGFKWSAFTPRGIGHPDIGNQTSIFGFPHAGKYIATASNLIQMSDFISQPFLLEKAVLVLSPELDLDVLVSGSEAVSGSITNFFLLNQRKPFNYLSKQKTVEYYRTGSNPDTFFSASTASGSYPKSDSLVFDYSLPKSEPLGFPNSFTPVASSSLVANYNFQNSFEDLSGNQLHLIRGREKSLLEVLNNGGFEPGHLPQARSFKVTDGDVGLWLSASLTSPSASLLQMTGSVVAEMIFRRDSGPGTSDQGSIIRCEGYPKTADVSTDLLWGVDYVNSGSFFQLKFVAQGAPDTATTFVTPFSFDTWYHVAILRKSLGANGSVDLYVQGNYAEIGQGIDHRPSGSNVGLSSSLIICGEPGDTTQGITSTATNTRFAALKIWSCGSDEFIFDRVRSHYSASFLGHNKDYSPDSSIRDVVTTFQLAAVTGNLNNKDLIGYQKSNFLVDDAANYNFSSSSVVLSSSMFSYKKFGTLESTADTTEDWLLVSSSNEIVGITEGVESLGSGRNGIFSLDSRGIKNVLEQPISDLSLDLRTAMRSAGSEKVTGSFIGNNRSVLASSASLSSEVGTSLVFDVTRSIDGNARKKDSPYILFPQDNLILGCQLPLPRVLLQTTGRGPILTFHPRKSKLILYGSSISGGRESHQTLNQLLTGINVHEVIE